MNTPEQHVEKTAEHEGFIKTPKQLITVILLAFIVPIAVIMLLIRLVTASSPLGVGSDAQSQEAVAKRIQPVAGFALVSADAATEERTGEQVYAATCSACHTAGVAGAPRLGDNAAWEPLLAKGFEDLLQNAIHGINAMPPRGGNPSLSDLEVARAVVHLTNESGASFPEPEAAGGDEVGEADASEGAAEAAPAAVQGEPQAAAAEQAAQAPTADQVAAGEQLAAAAQATAAAEQSAQQAPADGQAAAAEQAPTAAPAEEQPNAVALAGAADANIDLAAGEKLYRSVCFACHDLGVAGAPKVGDTATWQPLIAEGMDKMIKISLEGKGAMPPRGGSSASDEHVISAVHYMVNQSQ